MSHGIVSAGHEQTASAAIQILEQGGNAFDAIVAAGFASSVAEPVLTSLGGGGFLLAHNAQGLERLYDFFVQTPKKKPDPKNLDFYPIDADFGATTQEFHIGLGSLATPGMIAGLFEVHSDLGVLPIKEVINPAVSLCRAGIRINAFQQYLFTVVGPIYSATEDSRKVFASTTKPGKLVQEGDLIRFPELADTLEALAHEGKDLFYNGELGKRLVEQCREGGALTLKDMESYQVFKRDALEFNYQGHRLISNPPPSCGGILIAFTLNLLEKILPKGVSKGSAEELDLLAHAMELTNKARVDALSQVSDWTEAPGVLFNPDFLKQYREQIYSRPAVTRGTTHLNVIDDEGNVATMSLSSGEGCGHILKGTGIMLNNMLGEEDLCPNGFHKWEPNQRMASMMAPTVLFEPDGTMVAMGSGGSNRIRTAIVQVLKNLMDDHMTVEEAVEASRIHYERGLLSIEPGFPSEAIQVLAQDYPDHHLWKEKNLFFGGVHAVALHPDGDFEGAGDPRRAGVCLKV